MKSTISGVISTVANRVVHTHDAADPADLCRFGDEQLNFAFQLDRALDSGPRPDDDARLAALILTPTLATRFLDHEITLDD